MLNTRDRANMKIIPTWQRVSLPRFHQTALQYRTGRLARGRVGIIFILYIYIYIGLISRVFTYGRGNRGSILGRVIPKTQKWYLMPPCLTLSIIKYVSRVKWSNPGIVVMPSPTPRCFRYRKRTFGLPLTTVTNFIYIYIYI